MTTPGSIGRMGQTYMKGTIRSRVRQARDTPRLPLCGRAGCSSSFFHRILVNQISNHFGQAGPQQRPEKALPARRDFGSQLVQLSAFDPDAATARAAVDAEPRLPQ